MKVVAVLCLLPAGLFGFQYPTFPTLQSCSVQSRSHAMPVMSATPDVQTPAVANSRFEKFQMKWKGIKVAVPQSEMDEEVDYSDFDDLLKDQSFSFERGETVTGTIIQFEHNSCLVDIGAKAPAYLPLRECSLAPVDDVEDAVSLDQEMEFKIISSENENGQVTVSIKRLQFEQAWEKVQAMQIEDAVFETEILSINRGGAVCLLEGLRGFLPGSHFVGGVPDETMIGNKIKVKFLDVNPENGKLVVSNKRAVLEHEMQELSRGDVVDGVVKALKPYGAFVDVRGLSGLLHISQISYHRVEDLAAVLSIGQELKCMIIDHDKANGRIALSTKTLEPQPGDMLKDADMVYQQADETARQYHEKMEAERKQREEAAKSIVMGLGEGLDNVESDLLSGITDGIDSLLKPEPTN